MNTLLGVIGLVAAYVLIQRSADTTGTQAEKDYLPSEAKKKAVLSAMNQFPVTVEEEVIAKMLPMNNPLDLSEAEFKPVLGDTTTPINVKQFFTQKVSFKIIWRKILFKA